MRKCSIVRPTFLVFFLATMTSEAADRILLTRIGPSQAALMLSNSDGSGEVALTKGTLDYNPSWSADGRWIAFTSERDGSADLYRMHADGSGVERLTDDPSYDDQAFSPDGEQVSSFPHGRWGRRICGFSICKRKWRIR